MYCKNLDSVMNTVPLVGSHKIIIIIVKRMPAQIKTLVENTFTHNYNY